MTVEMLYSYVVDGVSIQNIAHHHWCSVRDVAQFVMRAGFNCSDRGDCGRYSYLKDVIGAGQIKILLSEYATLGEHIRQGMNFGEFVRNSGIDVEYISPVNTMNKSNKSMTNEFEGSDKYAAWNHVAESHGSVHSLGGKKRVNQNALRFMHDDWSAMTDAVKKSKKSSLRTRIILIVIGSLIALGIISLIIVLAL